MFLTSIHSQRFICPYNCYFLLLEPKSSKKQFYSVWNCLRVPSFFNKTFLQRSFINKVSAYSFARTMIEKAFLSNQKGSYFTWTWTQFHKESLAELCYTEVVYSDWMLQGISLVLTNKSALFQYSIGYYLCRAKICLRHRDRIYPHFHE